MITEDAEIIRILTLQESKSGNRNEREFKGIYYITPAKDYDVETVIIYEGK